MHSTAFLLILTFDIRLVLNQQVNHLRVIVHCCNVQWVVAFIAESRNLGASVK